MEMKIADILLKTNHLWEYLHDSGQSELLLAARELINPCRARTRHVGRPGEGKHALPLPLMETCFATFAFLWHFPMAHGLAWQMVWFWAYKQIQELITSTIFRLVC